MQRTPICLFFPLLLLSACDQQLAARTGLTLEEESGEALENVPQVVRFRLAGSVGIAIHDIWLVSGDVSSASQGKLERGEVPQTVEAHRQPMVAWVENETVVLAPSIVLDVGARYSFVALGVGLIGTFTVSSEERPVLKKWGPPFAMEGGEALYCAGPPPLLSTPAQLGAFDDAPGFRRGIMEGNVAADFCVRAQLDFREGVFIPPPFVDEFLLEPVPIDAVAESVMAPLDLVPSGCGELPRFRGGCVEITQGAVSLRVSPGYYFFSLFPDGAPERTHNLVLEVAETEVHTFGPLTADTRYQLEIVRFVPGGVTPRLEGELLEFESGPDAPRFVLTEVLADPLGSEPEAEWVEVMNIGTSKGSLGGLELWDSGGGIVLPDVVLGPGELGLIVPDDFSFEADQVPHQNAVRVSVPTLGENGLRNSGEEVSLRTAEGQTLSSIPAISARAGESVARLDAWLSDGHQSFEVRHTPTPGIF